MKKTLLAAIVSIIAFANNVNAASMPESFADLAEKLTPAVVNISTTQMVADKDEAKQLPDSPFNNMPIPPGHPLEEFKDLFDKLYKQYGENSPHDRNATSLGSGFIISEDGYVVTNNHVVSNSEEITVVLPDDSKFKAKLIGKDSKTDLALLKIETKSKLPYVELGDSDKSRVGDWVIAIGNPFGLGGTVTAGIISARARDINAGPFDDFIQTDAAINRGNSGGPMFNTSGEVIGINTAIFSPSGGSVGIGFALPSNLAKPVIEQLRKTGKIERGWLGVKIQTVSDEIAESVGMEKAKGALVVEVSKDSPAAEAEIQPGDIIISYDDKEITTMKKLPRYVAETKIGKKVDLVILREGKKINKTIKVEELKDETPLKKKVEKELKKKSNAFATEEVNGIEISELLPEFREKFQIPSEINGVIVAGLKNAERNVTKFLKEGDVITQANQKKVTITKDFELAVKEVKAEGKKSILLQIYRGGESLFAAIPVGKSE